MSSFLFSPGLILIFGAALVPVLPLVLRRAYLLLLPVICFWYILGLNPGDVQTFEFMGYQLEPLRVDKLALVWGYVFSLAAFLGVLFAIHQDDRVQDVSALVYAGSGISAVFAGDLISLFVFWELTAISSVFLIWASRTEASYRAGVRYLIIQIGSGVILLAGILFWFADTGSLAFGDIGIETLAGKLIFIAFGIKCAFPLLHNWLQDSYPQATPTGTVILSAFTTKLAVYALARGYAGTEVLIYIGATMTAFPIFFAVIENNLRKVLAYSLNNQLGFMVVGIGIGTPLALDGTAAHAFCHILYKALLFMSMGAVLHRTGTTKASELGGLYKSMPFTATFCTIGAMSISAFPLFSGFVSKSMILTAAAGDGYWGVWAVLVFASAGVMEHSGIKIPYFAFFAHDSGKRPKEAPFNMLLAMGITAFLCIAIGVYPAPLYAILPYPVDFVPYTTAHVITQLQLLMFSVLAFIVLIKTGLYPEEKPSTNLDFDWLYRRLLPKFLRGSGQKIAVADQHIRSQLLLIVSRVMQTSERWSGFNGTLARSSTVGSMASYAVGLLAVFLVLYFIA
ncbi:MAG: Na(+)/H(+) antiporter subunit D [Rhodospirillales bacterium]|nr:Na(+)/H(+) antiporter subunit D [Rhodospirillales bacterium]